MEVRRDSKTAGTTGALVIRIAALVRRCAWIGQCGDESFFLRRAAHDDGGFPARPERHLGRTRSWHRWATSSLLLVREGCDGPCQQQTGCSAIPFDSWFSLHHSIRICVCEEAQRRTGCISLCANLDVDWLLPNIRCERKTL